VVEQNRDGQVTALLRMSLPSHLTDRLRPVTHYNGTPIAAENIIRPILGWEKNPSGPGWPTGDVALDNPDTPHSHEISPE
jgi:2-oxoglutarate ferredoxin oxidoreductase subunit alpha